MIDEIEFAESKQNGDTDGSRRNNAPVSTDSDGFMNIPEGIDDKLPFN
jgi:single-strand DNA-binding protein